MFIVPTLSPCHHDPMNTADARIVNPRGPFPRGVAECSRMDARWSLPSRKRGRQYGLLSNVVYGGH
ncbi:MAG: hypothetical protein AAF471_05865 [Myxococcota bacterium]